MLDPSLVEKLAGVAERVEGLDRQMADPVVLSRPERYRELARERAELDAVNQAYGRYRKLLKEIEESRTLLEDQDAELRQMAKDELSQLEPQLDELTERIKKLLVPADPDDSKNTLLEIRAGTGGQEASLFASELFRMYARYAERNGWKVEVMSRSDSETGGLKEIIALVAGRDVYGKLKFEAGVHRVQRVPVTESQGRIHTSAATVAVLPEAGDVDIKVEDKDLRFDVFRSSGPGGQSVNTTDSAVRVTHVPTGLVVVCQDEKSQHKNKARALKILKTRLLDLEKARQHAEQQDQRRSLVRSGDRSEKVRTYNFPQDRLTDHRIGYTRHDLDGVLDGDLEDLIEALRTHHQAEKLKEEQSP